MSPGRLPARWASKQQRQLAIGASVVSQIVIDNQDVRPFSMKYSAMLVAAYGVM